MSTYIIDPNAKASATDRYVRISSRPNAGTPYHQQPIAIPVFTVIQGSLPGGKWLTRPLIVQIDEEDGEFLVSEPHFSIYASEATLTEAIEHFKCILAEELDILTADEEKLGSRLHAQLQYLRKAIRMA